jgi:hypothetical protein
MNPVRQRTLCILAVCTALAGVGLVPAGAAGNTTQRVSDDQLLLLREALRVVGIVGEQVWPGWGTTPKTTLIVGETHEFVVMIGPVVELGPEFTRSEQSFERWPIYSRPRTFSTSLRAALRIDDVPMAVVGGWDPAEESPNEWAISLVEQWFHLLQMQRGESVKVMGLGAGLAADTSSGFTWELEFPFPFDDPDVGNAMMLLGVSLYEFGTRANDLPRSAQRSFQGETARAALENLRTVLTLKYGDDAYAFFRLRTWRDGVARYSGGLVARLMAAAEERGLYDPVDGFDRLPEHKSYRRVWSDSFANQIWLIRTAQTDAERHLTSFDALGHGMAVMLDVVDPEWKQRYFEPDVWLDDMIDQGLDNLAEPERASARR